MIKNMDLLKQIIERRAKLDEVSKKLKQHFFGIDNVIDKIIKNIEVWYVMPELLTRPLIVCLWGMTGVGKTDLIRKLARHLNFHDSYVEIQLTSKGASESGRYDSGNSLKSLMSYSNLEPDRPGILLLDEIQRFRTVAQDGDDIHGGDFQDLWMLLSDGKFSNDYDIKNELLKMLCDIAFRKDGGHAYDD
jgi:predicted AAA+ superfamily ATPase